MFYPYFYLLDPKRIFEETKFRDTQYRVANMLGFASLSIVCPQNHAIVNIWCLLDEIAFCLGRLPCMLCNILCRGILINYFFRNNPYYYYNRERKRVYSAQTTAYHFFLDSEEKKESKLLSGKDNRQSVVNKTHFSHIISVSSQKDFHLHLFLSPLAVQHIVFVS